MANRDESFGSLQSSQLAFRRLFQKMLILEKRYINIDPLPRGEGVKRRELFMEKREEISGRLKSIAGHVKGIDGMVHKDAYCIDVIKQIQAVQAALNKVTTQILEGHLHSCLTTAVRGEDANERERVLKDVADVFEMSSKV